VLTHKVLLCVCGVAGVAEAHLPHIFRHALLLQRALDTEEANVTKPSLPTALTCAKHVDVSPHVVSARLGLRVRDRERDGVLSRSPRANIDLTVAAFFLVVGADDRSVGAILVLTSSAIVLCAVVSIFRGVGASWDPMRLCVPSTLKIFNAGKAAEVIQPAK